MSWNLCFPSLLESEGHRILVDAGLFPGERANLETSLPRTVG